MERDKDGSAEEDVSLVKRFFFSPDRSEDALIDAFPCAAYDL